MAAAIAGLLPLVAAAVVVAAVVIMVVVVAAAVVAAAVATVERKESDSFPCQENIFSVKIGKALRTDLQMDRGTDGQTDRPSYRDVRTHLKSGIYHTLLTVTILYRDRLVTVMPAFTIFHRDCVVHT